MAYSIADVIAARKGKPIREVIVDHQNRYDTIPEIATDWQCAEITVRRLLEKERFTLRLVPVADDEQP